MQPTLRAPAELMSVGRSRVRSELTPAEQSRVRSSSSPADRLPRYSARRHLELSSTPRDPDSSTPARDSPSAPFPPRARQGNRGTCAWRASGGITEGIGEHCTELRASQSVAPCSSTLHVASRALFLPRARQGAGVHLRSNPSGGVTELRASQSVAPCSSTLHASSRVLFPPRARQAAGVHLRLETFRRRHRATRESVRRARFEHLARLSQRALPPELGQGAEVHLRLESFRRLHGRHWRAPQPATREPVRRSRRLQGSSTLARLSQRASHPSSGRTPRYAPAPQDLLEAFTEGIGGAPRRATREQTLRFRKYPCSSAGE